MLMLPIKHYTLTLRATRHKRGPDAIDEPDLLYLACKFGGEFEQFVKGDLERPRDWWHTRKDWLTWMTTEHDPKSGKLLCPEKLRVPALQLSMRIEAMLSGEPSRVVQVTPAVAVVAEKRQGALF